MGKVLLVLCAIGIVLAMTLVPWHSQSSAEGQTIPPPGCTGHVLSSPMQGHYTGSWHSNADYHFAVHFPANAQAPATDYDIEMKVTIDGKLDVQVAPNGILSGTVTGDVQAPTWDNGVPDISGGIGTFSGQLSGVFSGTQSILSVSRSAIDMHWGTFGGRAIETTVNMPDYSFPVTSLDCVSSQGSVDENGFPAMNITNDSTGQLARAPGVGNATGTWQLTSDSAAKFGDLSRKVDTFLQSAGAVLADPASALDPALVERTVLQPLKTLEDTLHQDPTVSRCLLDRIAQWEAQVIPSIFQRAHDLAGAPTLFFLRQAGDLLQSARALNGDCGVPDGGAEAAIRTQEESQLSRAIQSQDWPASALFAREIIWLQPDGAAQLQDRLNAEIHKLVQQAHDSKSLLALGRAAYAFGDGADAGAAAARVTAQARADTMLINVRKADKKRKKPRKKPVATATPTPTPKPRTTQEVLSADIARIKTIQPSGPSPTFSWQALSGASRYVVIVTSADGSSVRWSWSGAGTSVAYGDTAIDGLASSGSNLWPLPLQPSTYTWSVLGLNPQGEIIGATFRIKP